MSNKAKIKAEAKKLNPINDVMFRKMAENKEFSQEILQIILEGSCIIKNYNTYNRQTTRYSV